MSGGIYTTIDDPLGTHGYMATGINNAGQIVGTYVDSAVSFTMTETAAPTAAKGGVGVVLSRPYIVGSVMLWLTYFMGLVIFYALINWMPILFKDAGLDPKSATLIAALFPLGGCGASSW